MPEKNTCILSYSNTEDISEAIKKLQSEKFDLEAVSIVGNANAHQKKLQPLLNRNDFPVVTEQNSIVAAGSIVPLMIEKHDEMDIHDLSILGVAFFTMGVPVESISEYEAVIKAERILLIVNAMRDEVEHSCKILHNESQQVTVHLA